MSARAFNDIPDVKRLIGHLDSSPNPTIRHMGIDEHHLNIVGSGFHFLIQPLSNAEIVAIFVYFCGYKNVKVGKIMLQNMHRYSVDEIITMLQAIASNDHIHNLSVLIGVLSRKNNSESVQICNRLCELIRNAKWNLGRFSINLNKVGVDMQINIFKCLSRMRVEILVITSRFWDDKGDRSDQAMIECFNAVSQMPVYVEFINELKPFENLDTLNAFYRMLSSPNLTGFECRMDSLLDDQLVEMGKQMVKANNLTRLALHNCKNIGIRGISRFMREIQASPTIQDVQMIDDYASLSSYYINRVLYIMKSEKTEAFTYLIYHYETSEKFRLPIQMIRELFRYLPMNS